MENDFAKPQACPACGSALFRPWRKGTVNLSLIGPEDIKITDKEYGRTWDLSCCENCGHIFADPMPAPSFINQLYSRIEDPLYQEESQGRKKNFAPILAFLGKLHPGRGILFDIGAATGILLSSAREKGWIAEGIEPSSWAVAAASMNYGLKIQQGDFETIPLPKKKYTAVTMVDFIEHISQPRQAVIKAGKILEEDGTLCLVTPDISSFLSRIAGKKWWHFRPAHLHYFNPKSLVFLLNQNGFIILKIRRYAWTFSAHYLISRVPWLNFLLKNQILASFWKSIPIKLALGDSLEVYARKMK
jgi:2-polyprenyl-3-methyl-5-hydroxy-6-metoxy-1,4-benzoquinol methylase